MPATNELNHIKWLWFLFCFPVCLFSVLSICFPLLFFLCFVLWLLARWLTAHPVVSPHWGLWLPVVLAEALDIALGLTWRTCNGRFVWPPWLVAGAVYSLLPELIRAKTRRIRRKQGFHSPPKTMPIAAYGVRIQKEGGWGQNVYRAFLSTFPSLHGCFCLEIVLRLSSSDLAKEERNLTGTLFLDLPFAALCLNVRQSFALETLEGVKVNWNMREGSWDLPAQPALVALTVGSAEFSDSKKRAIITSEKPTRQEKMILLRFRQYQQNCLLSSKELYFWHPCGRFWPVECYLWVRRKELDLTLNYKAESV